MGFWCVILVGLFLFGKRGVVGDNGTDVSLSESMPFLDSVYAAPPPGALMVALTLVQGAAAKGAGTLSLSLSRLVLVMKFIMYVLNSSLNLPFSFELCLN